MLLFLSQREVGSTRNSDGDDDENGNDGDNGPARETLSRKRHWENSKTGNNPGGGVAALLLKSERGVI